MHERNPVLNIQIRGNAASTARLYVFVECAWFLQSLFQQNKTNVSFREIARLIARNSFKSDTVKSDCPVQVFRKMINYLKISYRL